MDERHDDFGGTHKNDMGMGEVSKAVRYLHLYPGTYDKVGRSPGQDELKREVEQHVLG